MIGTLFDWCLNEIGIFGGGLKCILGWGVKLAIDVIRIALGCLIVLSVFKGRARLNIHLTVNYK
jgi:hypothetical protein